MLLLGAVMFSGVAKAGSSCSPTNDGTAANDKNFMLVAVPGGEEGTDCTTLTTKIRAYEGSNITDGTYDTMFVVAAPPIGNAARTLTSSDACAKRDSGTVNDEDFNGATLNGHVAVLVNNEEALPVRLAPAVYVKGAPKKGTKWSKLFFLTGNGTAGAAKNVCMLTDTVTGLVQAYCRVCTSKAKDNN